MSALEKNAADPYRQPLPRTPARRIADDAEAIRVARELAGLFAEEASLRDRQRRLPVAELEAFSQSGLWGISVPRAYGGAEVGYRTLAEVLKTIAAVDPSLAQLPQNHLAVLDHLRLDGSEEQKRFFYGLVLDGVRFGNAFSERHSRTVAEFQTRVLADGDGFRIDGRKFYSSGALLAHWVPAVGLDAEQRAHLAFIPRDAPGLTVIDDWSGFGQRTTASGTVILDNVRVPAEHVIPVHRAFDRPTAAGAVSQFIQAAIDAGIARGILAETVQQVRRHARPWIDANQQHAWEDPTPSSRSATCASACAPRMPCSTWRATPSKRRSPPPTRRAWPPPRSPWPRPRCSPPKPPCSPPTGCSNWPARARPWRNSISTATGATPAPTPCMTRCAGNTMPSATTS